MQPSTQKEFSSVGPVSIVLLFSTLGFVFGCVAGIIVAGISYSSVFASWKLLGGSMKFNQIVEVTSQNIWTQSDDGKIYSWNFNCYLEARCNKWIEAQIIPTGLHEFGEQPMEKGASCREIAHKRIRELSGDIVECALGQYSGPEYGASVYYALAEDGKIWSLQAKSSLIEAYVIPIYFSFGGLVLGIITSVAFMIWQKKENEHRESLHD